MKNTCFFNSANFWGGGEKLHLEYALEFKKKNYRVFLVSNKNAPLSKKASAQGLEIFSVSVGNLSFLNPFKILNLIRFYRKNEVDTVIFSASQDLKLGGFSAKLAGVKNIVYLRGLAVPIKNNLINRFIFKSILTHIVANSDETKRTILKNLAEVVDEKNVKTIYHGIELKESLFDQQNKLDIITQNARGVILGNAGRLTPQKGQTHLVELAKKLKDNKIEFTLFIAGTGELQSELERLIDKYELQNEVFLLGFVKDMDSFMNSIDVFLLSSIWEGFGYVLVEAMTKSKPVIAFDVSSNPEIVTSESGFLIDYADLDMFYEKTKLLITDESLRKSMGEAGKHNVIDRFDLKDRITEFEYYLLGKLFKGDK